MDHQLNPTVFDVITYSCFRYLLCGIDALTLKQKVTRITHLLATGDVEGKLQRLQWRPGQSSWRPFRFCAYVQICWRDYVQYTPRIMHTVRTLLCFVTVWYRPILRIFYHSRVRWRYNAVNLIPLKRGVFCEIRLWFIFCVRYYNEECNIMLYWATLKRHPPVNGTEAIMRTSQYQWSNPDGFG